MRDAIDDWIDTACEQCVESVEIDEWVKSDDPPLSADEVSAARMLLATWHGAEDFKQQADRLCSRCLAEDWFNKPQLKFLHDAFVLARFARDIGCEAVMLSAPSEQWPDGYIRHNGKRFKVEVVSTHGGRKLGKEYADVARLQPDPVESG